MSIRFYAFLSFLLFANTSYSQENFNIPSVPDGTVKKYSGNDMTPYENTSQFQQKYKSEQERRAQLELELKNLKDKIIAQGGSVPENQDNSAKKNVDSNNVKLTQTSSSTSVNNKVQTNPETFQKLDPSNYFQNPKVSPIKKMKVITEMKPKYKSPMIFTVSESTLNSYNTTVLPLGSYVKTRVLTGVEANENEPYPILLQADYAFVGPNGSKVDMSGCFFIAKAKGNLSTERVIGEITEMSCVRSNGEHFKRTVRGYIAGEDSTFGITGELISKQGQVLAAAVIANLAKGAGDALSLAQQQQTIAVGNTGSAATATNVTGSVPAFVAGKAVADASTVVAQWYLNYASKLVPSIAVGSGRDIWVVMLDDTNVPSLDDLNVQS